MSTGPHSSPIYLLPVKDHHYQILFILNILYY